MTYNYPSPDSVVEFTHSSIAAIMDGLSPNLGSRIAGLGIATPFRLWSWADTIGAPAGAMDAWRTSDIRADIASRYDFPVYLQNDATSACGAELVFGEVQSLADFLYFYIGTFIGGGVVLNGSLYTGHNRQCRCSRPDAGSRFIRRDATVDRRRVDCHALNRLSRKTGWIHVLCRKIRTAGMPIRKSCRSGSTKLPADLPRPLSRRRR